MAGGTTRDAAGTAAADFLRESETRPGPRPTDRPGVSERPRVDDRRSAGDRPLADNRPNRVDNRDERQQVRTDRGDEIRQHCNDHPVHDFWSDHPMWATWAIARPYRWAAWGGVTGWVDTGWTEPVIYDYGVNVYYEEGSVYYDEQPVATEEEYAAQAETIATSAPETKEGEWMPLGVFALTQDGQESGPEPTLFLQMVINKQGVIAGTFNNTATNASQSIQGMVDKTSQRAAWNISDRNRPIMETGVFSLTQDSAPALVHFEDGTTQQWLMVRLDDPQDEQKP